MYDIPEVGGGTEEGGGWAGGIAEYPTLACVPVPPYEVVPLEICGGAP